jgi:hypothetical protein
MADYDVGYGKPPISRRFAPGISGNSKGRPKRKPVPLAQTIDKVLNAPIEYRERGRTKVATAQELCLKMLVDRAVSGDLEASEIVLKIRERAERYGDAGLEQIANSDWMPDYAGQSGEQKGRDLERTREHGAPSIGQIGTAEK